ncbi:type II toxin-antitoxin system VapC family toxin [Mucilaginibacter sp. McL0603]|uniref:type II toxin-antitoxin system VapC family toxin n=1 Tax=Mucilaginibacter sp. McL0603 TaxID=3415670 RepID=UPI003CF73874
MNYLLDTHTLIWAITEKGKLSSVARKTIENTDNTILVSAISFWEITLKFSINKLDISGFLPEDLPGLSIKSGFNLIPLLPVESASYHHLPAIGLHKDPFDRMLIWQAIQQELILISKDKNILQYKSAGLKLIW